MSSANEQIGRSLDPASLHNKFSRLSKSQGITKWDLGAYCSSDVNVQVDRSRPKQLKGSQRSSITVRVWNNEGLVGITSTSDLTDVGIQNALSAAKAASHFGNKKDIPDFSSLSQDFISPKEENIRPKESIDTLLNILKECESDLLKKHKAISNVPYNGLSESYFERLYINSEEANRFFRGSQSSIYLYARAQELKRKPRSSGAVRLAYSSTELDLQGCIEEAASKTISHLDYRQVNTGKYLICFSPESFLDLINSFSNIFNARSILDGVSLSTRKSLGEQLAVPSLNIEDDGLHIGNIGASNFDGEGTPVKKLKLIEGGVLRSLLHSESTARQFNTVPTGHAGFGAKVSVGPDWLIISNKEGIKDENQNLRQDTYMGKYILVDNLNALHAGIKPSQGSFSLPFDGWIVENGTRQSIDSATIAGDIKMVLKNIVKIESSQKVTHHGVSPHVWVEGLSITGEE